jgi:hypothetical protein
VASARGDLDGDGTLSTFELGGKLLPNGEIEIDVAFVELDREE